MKRPGFPHGLRIALMGLLALAALPAATVAQDFLFRTPRAMLGFRYGYAVASASSEIFDFTRNELTVGSRDFDAPAIGAELAIRVAPRVDVTLSLMHSSALVRSEFRDWVDQDDLPIEQETEFKRTPITFSGKYYLRDRGRSIGRFAWIPNAWAPYVGAGGGWMWYNFVQRGDFVDFDTLDIFRDGYSSNGTTPTVHLLAGADLSLNPDFVLSGEARYTWASAEMDSDFVGFDPLDLSGLQITAGISIRF